MNNFMKILKKTCRKFLNKYNSRSLTKYYMSNDEE